MFIYFVAFSILLVGWVFDSAAVDYRFVALGSVIPLVEVPTGHAWALHTLLAPILAFGAVAILARGRRIVQRQWIGIPIGMFLHLLLDRTWVNAEMFWWPVAGRGELGTFTVPELDPVVLSIGLEVLGIVLLVWIYRKASLDDAATRARLINEGRLTLR